MATKTVQRKGASRADAKFKFESIGDTLKGTYLGSETFDYQGSPLTAYKFKTDDNKIVSTLESADLNDQLPQVPVGAYTTIVYTKKLPLKGGKSMKMFDINYEEEGL